MGENCAVARREPLRTPKGEERGQRAGLPGIGVGEHSQCQEAAVAFQDGLGLEEWIHLLVRESVRMYIYRCGAMGPEEREVLVMGWELPDKAGRV